MRAGRLLIFFHVDIWHHNASGIVDIIAVSARDVVNVLLDNGETAKGGIETFASGGKLRDPNEHSALVKIGALLGETDLD